MLDNRTKFHLISTSHRTSAPARRRHRKPWRTCTMTDLEHELTSVSSRTLCRRYALAIPEVTFVRVRDASDVREHPLFWVFGWLADGECEPLGLCIGAHALPPMLAGF